MTSMRSFTLADIEVAQAVKEYLEKHKGLKFSENGDWFVCGLVPISESQDRYCQTFRVEESL